MRTEHNKKQIIVVKRIVIKIAFQQKSGELAWNVYIFVFKIICYYIVFKYLWFCLL